MIKHFQKYLDDKNYDRIVSMVTSPRFLRTMTAEDIAYFKIYVNQKQQTNQHIKIALIAAIILRKSQQLTTQQQKSMIEFLLRIFKKSNQKNIIASLLLRLKGYTNLKLIIPHLEPDFVSLKKMSEVAQRLRQASHNGYEKILNKYRLEWANLMNGIDFNVSQFEKIHTKLLKETDSIDIYEIEDNLESQFNFLIKRIENLEYQKIQLNQFCQSFEKILTMNDELTNDHLEGDIPLKNLHLKIKYYTFRILNKLLLTIKTKFIRKFNWLISLIQFNLRNVEDVQLLSENFKLIENLVQVFGTGSFRLEQLIYLNQNNLLSLIQMLLKKRQTTHKSTEEEMQFKKDKKNKLKNQTVSLNLFEKQNIYMKLLESLNKQQAQYLLCNCISLVYLFYKKYTQSQHTNKLVELMDLYVHKLNKNTLAQYSKIKNIVFPKTMVYSPNIQTIIQQTFYSSLKKKRIIQLAPYKTELITIYPQERKLAKQDQIKKAQPAIFKKTTSMIEIVEKSNEYEGWVSQSAHINKVEQTPVAIQGEVFYSFKQSRTQNHDDYIVTPEF